MLGHGVGGAGHVFGVVVEVELGDLFEHLQRRLAGEAFEEAAHGADALGIGSTLATCCEVSRFGEMPCPCVPGYEKLTFWRVLGRFTEPVLVTGPRQASRVASGFALGVWLVFCA